MITVVLRPGESVRIELHETDGGFDVEYGEKELQVRSDLPGSHLGQQGVIYREVFAGCTCKEGQDDPRCPEPFDPRCPEHGAFGTAKVVGGK